MEKIPVVAILGHIDHGKSSLLEAIREDFSITKKEAGGITQKIGAYQAEIEGKKITFIDTPGHEVFSQMRSRGAKVADIAVLVIAAEEGIKPQTEESIKLINEAKIPFIVALNKIDKKNANPQKVKKELQEKGILIEEYGGEIPCVEVSAKTKQGIKELLETLMLLWEIKKKEKKLKKDFSAFVIETFFDALRGPVVNLIVEKGEVKVGDIIGSESTFGKIKRMEDFQGRSIKRGLPGDPISIIGLKELPSLGEKFKKFESEKEAQLFLKPKKEIRFEEIPQDQEVPKIILKADSKGTLEAIFEVLKKISQKKFAIIKGGIGNLNFSDLKLAHDTQAKIVLFRTKIPASLQNLARQKNIEILSFDVIYHLLEGVQKLIEKKREERPKIKKEIGKVEILFGFKTQSKKGGFYRQIVGGRIIEGEVKKGEIEIERKNEIVGKGKILEIQKQKRKIKEAKKGEEIGILYEGKGKIKVGDRIKVYIMV